MKEPVSFPSPNVASLGVFGKVPVSYYTGTPQINVPLYTLKSGKFEMPISLGYFSTGVMPDNHPGWVGLNWNLSAGGTVTRVVNGLPDENNYVHYWENSQTKTITNAGFYYNYAVCNNPSWETYSYTKSLASDKFQSMRDTEPDEFIFNFPGGRGSFYLGEDRQWKVKSDGNIQVRFDNTFLTLPDIYYSGNSSYPRNDRGFSGFTLTTDNGTQFVFGGTISAVEYSIKYWKSSYEDYIINSWQLTKIITPEGKTVEFEYEKDGVVMNVQRSMFNRYKQEYRTGYFHCEDVFYPYPQNIFGFTNILISPSYLKKIRTPLQELTFFRSNSTELRYSYQQFRINPTNYYDPQSNVQQFWVLSIDPTITSRILGSDLFNRIQWKKLDRISIAERGGMLNNSYQYEFSYSNAGTQRLTLLSLDKTRNSISEGKYQFQYYDNPAISLPAYASTMVDHWGYYNAKGGNTELENWPTGNKVPESFYSNYWNERVHSTDADVLREGSLKKIIYPTGGFSEFEYEPHSYSKEVSVKRDVIITNNVNKGAGGIRIRRITEGSGDGSGANMIRDFFYAKDYRSGGTLSSGVLSGQSQYFFEFSATVGEKHLRQKLFSSDNILPFSGNDHGAHIGYSEVTEKRSDGSYTIYRYTNHDNGYKDELVAINTDIPSRIFTPYDPSNDKTMERGHLLSVEMYNGNGQPVFREENRYSASAVQFARAINTGSIPSCDGVTGYATCFSYRKYIYNFNLVEKVTSTYGQNGGSPVVKKTDFEYGHARYNHPTKMSTVDSKGAALTTEFKHPYDFESDAVYQGMVSKNIIAPVIEKTEKIGSKQVSFTRNNYYLFNRMYLPRSIEVKTGDNNIETRLTYDFYDVFGNPLQITRGNSSPTSYIWSYDYEYPVAEVKNSLQNDIGYISFENKEADGNFTHYGPTTYYPTTPAGRMAYNLSNGDLSRHMWSTDKPYILTYWANSAAAGGISGGAATPIATRNGWTLYRRVFEGLASFRLSGSVFIDDVRLYPLGASMTTYTYDPMEGITSSTDASDHITYYKYGGIGRLQYIQDQDKNIIESYDYKYRNQ